LFPRHSPCDQGRWAGGDWRAWLVRHGAACEAPVSLDIESAFFVALRPTWSILHREREIQTAKRNRITTTARAEVAGGKTSNGLSIICSHRVEGAVATTPWG